MSAPAPAPAKRALSTSPPPPPAAPQAAADHPDSKRVKLSVEDPVSVPPVLVEAPAAAPAGDNDGSTAPPPRPRKPTHQHPKQPRKPRQRKGKPPKPGGAEEAGAFDVVALLGEDRVAELNRLQQEEGRDWVAEAEREWGQGAQGKDLDVQVVGWTDHGDGLALLTPEGSDKPTRLVQIPFALEGERVRIHIHRHEPDYFMSHADLVDILEPSPRRTADVRELPGRVIDADNQAKLDAVRAKFGNRVQCQHFGECSGCQYQPLAYDEQLEMKREVVRRAFANFSGLDPALVPAIGPTLPSPLEYGYRTKLTPHFQVPPSKNPNRNRRKPKAGADGEAAQEPDKEWEITIGFEQKGRKRIVDIEECVIATSVINRAMVDERAKVKRDISAYKRGATILLRDSLPPRAADAGAARPSCYTAPSTEEHICVTDHHETVREQVGDVEFLQKAGSFFQNNASILPSLMDAVKAAIGPKPTGSTAKRYLVDAYCGSGLFAISLADLLDKVEGIEIDKASIVWAKKNAAFNHAEGRGDVGFRDGKAEDIFGSIEFPRDQTTVLIDPPRKGCDDAFLRQLLNLKPATIIYVSCNVRSQARDIGWLLKKSHEEEGSSDKGYRIESLRAADLFAQTHHAEGVAILRRDV
ncbi:hypothetical protein JCM9279_001543 [Rhodotorula babjevae]